jgi:hypothetical protein
MKDFRMATASMTNSTPTRNPKSFYAHLDGIEGALAKVGDDVLFFAWESGAIIPVDSYARLTVLGEIGLADAQALDDLIFSGGFARIATSRAN